MLRNCGECTLCCKLLPVKELKKPALTRCEHQGRKGCKIYSRRPYSCAEWSCQWVLGSLPVATGRPNEVGYVVDPVPDYITLQDEITLEETNIPVVVIWVDPEFFTDGSFKANAAFGAWVNAKGEEGWGLMFREGSSDALVSIYDKKTKSWMTRKGTASRPQDTHENIMKVVGNRKLI